MTPCEEKGWKPGDWFLALSCQDYFEEGEKIYLSRDDGSRVPQFSNGKDYCYLGLSAVTPLKTQKETQTHTSRNGVIVKPRDKVRIIGSDNKHWQSREGLIGVVKFRDGEARIIYEDARSWTISDNTDIELVEDEGAVLFSIEDSEGNLYVEAGVQTIFTQQPEASLADQLEQALANLESAEKEVERLQTAYREAYPLIHRGVF